MVVRRLRLSPALALQEGAGEAHICSCTRVAGQTRRFGHVQAEAAR